jgi:hypothetical protein
MKNNISRMKTILIQSALPVLVLCAFIPVQKKKSSTVKPFITITWVDNIPGDFSFTRQWNYHDNVFRNDYGELICDGDCPPYIYELQDSNSRVVKDSMKVYYERLDTSHQYHSMQCDAWTYGWSGTDYVDVIRISKDSLHCTSRSNPGTYSNMHLGINSLTCNPFIIFHSINMRVGTIVYPCNGGLIKIDRNLWNQGIMKAEFSFTYEHKEKPKQPMYWKGKIYAEIKNQ